MPLSLGMEPAHVVDLPSEKRVSRANDVIVRDAGDGANILNKTSSNNHHGEKNTSEQNNDASANTDKAQKPQPFSHSALDPKLRPMLFAYIKPVLMTTVIVMFMVWLFCTIYWGSLYGLKGNSDRLKGIIVNRDNGIIGQTLTQAFLDVNGNDAELPHSTWEAHQTSEYPTHQALAEAIEPKEKFYIALEITQDATQRLIQARANGDTNYNPMNLVNLIYTSARNPTSVPKYVLQPAQKTFRKAQVKLNAQLTADFIAENVNNPDALQTANRAPLTLTNPVDWKMLDLRPWTSDVALAPTFVGLIYLVILSLQVVLAEYGGLFAIRKFLHYRAYATLRIATPVLSSIFISLMITMLNIPFDLPFETRFPYGGGFMVYWLCTYCGIVLFMLCLESVVTFATPRFIGVFLMFFIISNVSVSNNEIKIMPRFYRYGYAMPFYNLRRIYLGVLCGVGERHEILKYIGIIWAWMFGVIVSFLFIMWLDYHKNYKRHLKSMAPKNSTP